MASEPKRGVDKEIARKGLESILGADKIKQLEALIAKERASPPKVAIIGKAGVGKTTTINNLFNASWKTSHTVAGTKNAQMEEFDLAGGGRLAVVDMPGLGEDVDQDAEYEKIYRTELPSADIVIWVMQANAKDMAEDQRILSGLIADTMKGLEGRIVVALNQVDKIGPGEWNEKLNYPTPLQAESIERRCADIATKLARVTPVSRANIVHYSALRRYRLYDVLISIINASEDRGWKFPIHPADPIELADPEVQEFAAQVRSKKERSGE